MEGRNHDVARSAQNRDTVDLGQDLDVCADSFHLGRPNEHRPEPAVQTYDLEVGFERGDLTAIAVAADSKIDLVERQLVRSAVEKMAQGRRIVLAMDNDDGGRGLVQKLSAVFGDSSHAECVLEIDMPPTTGEDWNDVLRACMRN